MGSVFPRRQDDPEVPWLRESLQRLRAAGVQVEVLAPSWRGLSDHEIDGIPVKRFRYAPASLEILTHDEGAPSKVARNKFLQLLAVPYILNGSLRCLIRSWRFRPNVIHAHWPFPHGLMALPACKLLGIPLVLNFHGAELMLAKKFPWVSHVLRFVIGQAQAVLANSSFTAGLVRAVRPVTVMLSPYGSPLQARPRTREPFAGPGPWRILFVGRHIERKGVEYLIRALPELAHPDQWELRIPGSGDWTPRMREAAQAILREAGPGAALPPVQFLGRLPDAELAEEYANADLFVLPAVVDSKGDTEGLGVVLVEAVANGLPIIASQVGGIVDVVKDGTTGLLVPPKDPVALARALERLAADPELRKRVVAGATTLVQELFSWDRIVEDQLALYATIARAEGDRK